MDRDCFFQTRGVVLVTRDIETLDWPRRAHAAGLTTLATHVFPQEVADFLATESGQRFLEQCRDLGLRVEHELHAMTDFLPRDLFDTDPEMFRMDEDGNRVREDNLCVSSPEAMEIVAERAAHYTRLLPSTTGRYFYWPDDGKVVCRCPECRHLSDSDQMLVIENHILAAVRAIDPRATLAHLVYTTTLQPPSQVRPEPGIFMEFAPIARTYDQPLRAQGPQLEYLDANLAVFGAEGAQALEYWLDESLFCGWKREDLRPIPWNQEAFLDDLDLYASRGVGHVTTFAAWIDGDYVARFGEPPIREYGEGLLGRPPQHPDRT